MVTKRGKDGLVHFAYGEGFSMAVCSVSIGGRSGIYIVDTYDNVVQAHVTCLWCVQQKEDDARLY